MAFPACDEDVFGNGKLIRRIVEVGDVSLPKPSKGDLVELEIQILLVDGEEISGKGLRSFRLGEGDECDALEVVAPLMRPQEKCAIRSIPLAFGLDAELCIAKPGATVEAVVKLRGVQHPCPVVEKAMSVRASEARKKKDRGNFLFKREEYQAAAVSFSLGLSYIAEPCHNCKKQLANEREGQNAASDSESKDEAEQVADSVIALCCELYTNLALVQLKLPGEARNASASCEGALSLKQNNVKALYLRAKAILCADNITDEEKQEAKNTLECLLQIAPDNQKAKDLLTEAQKMDEGRETKESKWLTIIWLLGTSVTAIALAIYQSRFSPFDPPIAGSEGGLMREDDF